VKSLFVTVYELKVTHVTICAQVYEVTKW